MRESRAASTTLLPWNEAVAQIRRTGFCLSRATKRPAGALMKSVARARASRPQWLL
jgi:hypothetical protein